MLKNFWKSIQSNKVMRILGYVSLPFFPLYSLFIMDYFNFYKYNRLESLLYFVKNHPYSLLFEILVVLVMFIIFLLICRKAVIAAGIFGFLSYLFAYINYVKMMQNGDNFFPKDILMLGSAGELVSFISCPLPKWFYIGLVVMIIWVLLYACLKTEIPLKWYIRCPAALIIVIAILFSFSTNKKSQKIVNTFGIYFEDTILQSSNYRANGFVGAFTLNILTMNVEEPDGYSKDKMDQLLSGYTETAMDEDAPLYDIILVLSESFSDIRLLDNVTFSENPLSNYDRIISDDNCYSGYIYTTALGGGTVRPEFDILSGLTTEYLPSGASPYEYVHSNVDTYLTNYKSEGYSTLALHLYDKSFYSRSTAYPYIGFDEFYGLDDMKDKIDISYKRGWATDDSTLDAIKYLMDNSEKPTFLFTITIQNHQPYRKMDDEDTSIGVSSDVLTESELTALSTYTQGLYDNDKMLGDLVDYIDSRERPTILVFYGDHYPSLGTNFSVFQKGGLFDANDYSTENRMTMYSTPFLIYSNCELDPGIFDSNTNNDISTYNLLNAVAVSTGFKRTSYMNALLDFYNVTPMYNTRLAIDATDEISRYADMMKYVTYDQLIGKKYTAVK